MSTKPEYGLIVAGGIGTRMKNPIPKQFLILEGLPVLMHTIRAFDHYNPAIKLILVLPAEEIPTWAQLCKKYQFDRQVEIVEGGSTRFESVKNGLSHLNPPGLVAIHDGVRPLVNADIIGASFRIAAIHQSAVASVRLKESLRITDQDTTKSVDRSKFRLIQTPQTFDLEIIKKAYQGKEDPSFTDDAGVAERIGVKISLFEGSYENIKITTPEDLDIARVLMQRMRS